MQLPIIQQVSQCLILYITAIYQGKDAQLYLRDIS